MKIFQVINNISIYNHCIFYSLYSVIVNDDFTKKLFDIYLTVRKEGIKQVYAVLKYYF